MSEDLPKWEYGVGVPTMMGVEYVEVREGVMRSVELDVGIVVEVEFVAVVRDQGEVAFVDKVDDDVEVDNDVVEVEIDVQVDVDVDADQTSVTCIHLFPY